jgi:transcription antitermination factor NusG
MMAADETYPLSLQENSQPWYAVHVRSRFEYATSSALRDRGYESFLPVYRSKRAWSDRVKELDMPLFPGYVFCRFDATNPWGVVNSPGVAYVVSAGKQYLPVDDQEIAALRALCGSKLAVEPWPYLEVGRRVVLERGPLCGAEGIVVELKKQARIVVSVSLLRRSVSAEIDREWIRPLQTRDEGRAH